MSSLGKGLVTASLALLFCMAGVRSAQATDVSAQSEPDSRVWGPLAKLVETTWSQASLSAWTIFEFSWLESGDAIEFIESTAETSMAPTRTVFRHSGEPGILRAHIQRDGKNISTRFRFGNDGVLISDWYKLGAFGPVKRDRILVTQDGRYYFDFMIEKSGSQREFDPVNVRLLTVYKQYSGADLQALAAARDRFVAGRKEANFRQLEEHYQQRRRASQERVRSFNRAMEGLNVVLSQTNEATGGYAEAQANLDATVANINAAAAAERQQQALAEQQAQARAAEEQRQQLAQNAHWVAEKEQAAAEYRSSQVDAAAEREEARVLAANAEAAAERVRRVEAQRQQAAADANGSAVGQKPPASAGTSILGGPKESGRSGSTCNEELACRKTCAGDVVAVTECVKQCARESACRVGIQ